MNPPLVRSPPMKQGTGVSSNVEKTRNQELCKPLIPHLYQGWPLVEVVSGVILEWCPSRTFWEERCERRHGCIKFFRASRVNHVLEFGYHYEWSQKFISKFPRRHDYGNILMPKEDLVTNLKCWLQFYSTIIIVLGLFPCHFNHSF